MKLTIELVPKTSWYNNVRSNVSQQRWNELRNHCYNKAGHKCEICGSTGKKQGFGHDVECHEIWEYDDENGIQQLVGLIALCPLCHKVKHIGLAQINGEYNLCIKHLRKVNGWWSNKKTEKYIKESIDLWMQRSQYDWKVDISWLDKNGDQLSDLLSKMNKFRKD